MVRELQWSCQCQPPFDWHPYDVTSWFSHGSVNEEANSVVVSSGDSSEGDSDFDGVENMGSKEKQWLEAPGSKERWLFKFARSKDGYTRGEDWAEYLVHVAAQYLCLPSACIAFAQVRGERGIISKSVLKDTDSSLVHGSELLSRACSDYDKGLGRNNPGYNLSAIQICLDKYAGYGHYSDWPAFDLFAGYLMMDALLSAKDRHHENWAVILRPGNVGVLAPSFDHGNALAFSELPEAVNKLLSSDKELELWLARGKSQHFAGKPKPQLVQLASDALSKVRREHREYLIRSLVDFPLGRFQTAVESLPEGVLSEAHGKLIVAIVDRNRRRLTDEFDARGFCQ